MEVSDEFRSRYDAPPAVVASAPGRVNLIGEHLDYNGGPVLPIALEHRTYVAATPRSDGMHEVASTQRHDPWTLDLDELGDLDRDWGRDGWAAYVAGVVWALEADLPGATVLVDVRVPLGAGLSSSAALECAVAYALAGLAGVEPDREEVVAACVRAENDFVGAATGRMDQTVSVFAEAGHALLVDFGDDSRRQVPWAPPGDLVVIDTRAHHELVGGEYADRRRSCEEVARLLGLDHLAAATMDDLTRVADSDLLRRARHVVSETERVHRSVRALEERDWEQFGALMTESHESLRDDFEVSCAELDVAVDAAFSAGALGARMTGGGFGGSAIALVPPGATEQVQEAVRRAFADAGMEEPRFIDGTSGGPAALHTP